VRSPTVEAAQLCVVRHGNLEAKLAPSSGIYLISLAVDDENPFSVVQHQAKPFFGQTAIEVVRVDVRAGGEVELQVLRMLVSPSYAQFSRVILTFSKTGTSVTQYLV
jgi:hypothetical protein